MMQSAGAQGAANPLMGLLPFFLIMVVFYFLLIRPQRKQQKEVQNLQNNLKKNDYVVTSGGIHGVVANVKESTVSLKIADNVKIEINKNSIAYLVTDKSKIGELSANTLESN